jgi:hypothetical protein
MLLYVFLVINTITFSIVILQERELAVKLQQTTLPWWDGESNLRRSRATRFTQPCWPGSLGSLPSSFFFLWKTSTAASIKPNTDAPFFFMKHGSPVSWANMRNKIEIHVKNDKSPKTNARRKRLTAIYDLNWKFGTRDYNLGTGNSRGGSSGWMRGGSHGPPWDFRKESIFNTVVVL